MPESGPVELTTAEVKLSSTALISAVLGEFGLRVLGNTTGVWWPFYVLAGCFFAFFAGFALYLARTRSRSIRSILALGIPERLRRRRL